MKGRSRTPISRQTRAQPLMIMAIRLAGLLGKNRDQSE
jgi:hypothetical protein